MISSSGTGIISPGRVPTATSSATHFGRDAGDLVGWYFADITSDGYADVFQLAARPEHRRAAMITLLHDLDDRGVVDVSGDAPLELLFDLEGLGCQLTTNRATTAVHTSDPGILAAFRANRVWLSALEGEYLLNPPAAVRQ